MRWGSGCFSGVLTPIAPRRTHCYALTSGRRDSVEECLVTFARRRGLVEMFTRDVWVVTCRVHGRLGRGPNPDAAFALAFAHKRL